MSEDQAGPSAALTPLARARLDDLLEELLERVDDVLDTQDRLRGLLDAVVAIASDLALDSVLERIVNVARQLAGAQYGALGVLEVGTTDRRLSAFITEGVDEGLRARIGPPPAGHGLLGAIIDDPRPLRLPAIGDDARSYGFPPHHPPMGTFLGVPIRIRDKVFGNLYLTEKRGGGEFTEEDEEIVVALAAAAGVVIENARLYDETGRRQRWLEASADMTARLLGPVDEKQAQAIVAEKAREAAGADVCTLLLRSGAGRLRIETVAGAESPNIGREVRVAGTLLGDAEIADEAVVVQDLGTEPRWGDLGLAPGPAYPRLGPVVLLPMRSGGDVGGVLLLGWDEGNAQPFRELDVRLPAAFADQAALALQVARSREDRARLAVLVDRDRIGRDLHDVVIQRLFAVGLSLQAMVGRADDDETSRRVGAAVDDLDTTIRDIRRTIFELQSPRDSGDLRAQLASTVEEVAPALGFEPTLSTYGPVDSLVPEPVRPHLVAVLREALTNVARHAAANAVQVHVDVADDVTLTVRDDGKWYEDNGRSSGLGNMAERARELGGSFVIRPATAGGTVLTWQVPLGRHASSASG